MTLSAPSVISFRSGHLSTCPEGDEDQGRPREPPCPQMEGDHRPEDPDTQSQSDRVLLGARLSGTGSGPNSQEADFQLC